MPEQLRIASPDFNRILSGDNGAIHDAIKTLWLANNESLARIDKRRHFWSDVPFAAGNFTASAGTWTVATGDMKLYRYLLVDRLLVVEFALETTTTSGGMGTSLYIATPNFISAQNTYNTGFVAVSGSITEIGVISTRSGASATSINLTRADGSSWPSSVTDNLGIRGMMALEI